MQAYSRFSPELDCRLWQCPVPSCQRIEETILTDPICAGTPERRHAEADTEVVADGTPTDRRRLFL